MTKPTEIIKQTELREWQIKIITTKIDDPHSTRPFATCVSDDANYASAAATFATKVAARTSRSGAGL